LKIISISLILLLGFITFSSAHAAIFKVDYSGSINTTFGGFPGLVPVSGSYTYSTVDPVPGGAPGGAIVSEAIVNVGGVILDASISGAFIFTSNDANAGAFLFDRYQFRVLASPSQFLNSDIRLIKSDLTFDVRGPLSDPPTLVGADGIPPTDAALLLAIINPVFPPLSVTFENIATGGFFGVDTALDTLTITEISEVPIPAAMMLFPFGIAALSLARRRRKIFLK